MRALSLWRPWPWAFIHGNKRIENRPWEIKFRGDVVFQAAKKFDDAAVPVIQRVVSSRVQTDLLRPTCSGLSSEHPAGVLAFIGAVVDCVPYKEAALHVNREIVDDNIAWGKQRGYVFGPWCAVVVNIRPLRPIPWKGSQGWFDVPDAIVAEALATA